ncbi:MAG TPA: hypothetical protein VG867_10510 [Rhizomicrobium sp.]|nr:hypothetical protein [Rhizomicrobium sp.]
MFRVAFLVFLAALMLGSAPASAQGRYAPPPGVVPLDRVLPQVRSRYPGTFYDADGPYMDERGNPHYRLKWMTPEGRVIWLDTDARTGRVIGVERGRNRGQYAMPPRDAPPPEYYEKRQRNYRGNPNWDRSYREQDRRGRDRGWNGGHGGWGGDHGGGHGGHGHHGG